MNQGILQRDPGENCCIIFAGLSMPWAGFDDFGYAPDPAASLEFCPVCLPISIVGFSSIPVLKYGPSKGQLPLQLVCTLILGQE